MSETLNKCICCGNNIGSDSYCKICGKSPISIAGGQSFDTEKIKNMTKQYIHNLLKDVSIQIKCFTYSINDDECYLESENFVEICSAENYWVGDIIYMDTIFKNLISDHEITVDLRIINKNGNNDIKLTIRPNVPVSRDKLGIQFTEGMKAKLIVGSGDNIAYSDEFSIYKSDESV